MSATVDTPLLDSLTSSAAHRARLKEITMRAEELMRPYVPVDQSFLRDSVMVNPGMLTWNTPYAANHYYVPMNHSEAGTQDHWDEAMKRNDMPLLEEYAAEVYEEVR